MSAHCGETLFREGVAAHMAGNLAVAADKYERILKINPNHAGALANLGRIARVRKDDKAALDYYKRAALAPGAPPEIFFNLGNVLVDFGNLPEAKEAFSRAVIDAPGFAKALDKLAACQEKLGEIDEAVATAHKAVEVAGENVPIIFRAGKICESAGQAEAAIGFYRRALTLKPDLDEAGTRLSQLIFRQGKADEAVAILRSILARRPDDAIALQNLGFVYRSTGHYVKALSVFEQARDLADGKDILKVETANCLVNLGRVSEGRARLKGLMETPQGRRNGGSSYLMALLYDPDAAPEFIRDEHKRLTSDWRCYANVKPKRSSRKDRPLRVGYLTGDFYGEHPVSQFIAPVIREHAKAGSVIETIAYDANPRHDATAKRMSSLCDVRNIGALDDAAAAKRIAEDNLDILVDLSGHASGRRLPLLGLRPAPVQACFIGYPSTTGFKGVDCLIADDALIQTENEHLYTERIARLPNSFLCFSPPAGMPAPSPKLGGEITFGSLNHLPKLNDAVIEIWCEILKRVPKSRLLLQCAAFAESETSQSMRERFMAKGADTGRLALYGPQPFADAMKRYAEIDIALDPFPYNGGTTTCHALWMGTPVISLGGEYFCGRMGVSILKAADREEWVAVSVVDYVEKAVALASDRAGLRREQARLAADIQTTKLCDIDDYARALADLYRRVCCGAQ